MSPAQLSQTYAAYLACLNARDWERLGDFVAHDVRHNGRPFGLAGYRAMLEQDYSDIADLRFVAEMVVAEPPYIAARLGFTCAPRASFLGLPVNGRTVSFSENVFYRLAGGKIVEVFSIIDRQAIAAQLDAAG